MDSSGCVVMNEGCYLPKVPGLFWVASFISFGRKKLMMKTFLSDAQMASTIYEKDLAFPFMEARNKVLISVTMRTF